MKVLFFLFFITSLNVRAQLDTIHFVHDWQQCGLTSSFSIDGAPEYFFDAIKAELDLGISDYEVLQTIFKQHRSGGIIFFESGPYIFNHGIRIPNGFVLAGMNKESTYFIFDELEKETDLFLAEGKLDNKNVPVIGQIPIGTDQLFLADTEGFKRNDWVIIRDDDSELITSSWANGKTGQLMKIRRVREGTIYFDSAFRRNYQIKRNPWIQKVFPAQNVGITDIQIINNQETEMQTSNVQFRFAVDCFVSNISSKRSNYAHVLLEYAANCMVLDSEFKDGHSYGAGGKGYGVVLQFASSECLIKGNKFNHLRHSMLLQAGANGNVFIQNTSIDPYWKEPFLPKRAAGDLTLHGNYAYYNLFTENKIQNLVIDNSHGKSGPNNFFINNEIESYGIIMNKKQATDSCYFIGNQITGKGLFKGKYRIKGKGHVEAKNTVKGKIRPSSN